MDTTRIPRQPGPDAVDAARWLRQEQARLRPALVLAAFLRTAPSPAQPGAKAPLVGRAA